MADEAAKTKSLPILNGPPQGDQNNEAHRHLGLFSSGQPGDKHTDHVASNYPPEILATPLFSRKVKETLPESGRKIFPSYGLLGLRTATSGTEFCTPLDNKPSSDNLIYANTQEPWSAFICGQQGAGKSYTMSCLLENYLLNDKTMGPNPHPMSGVVFHYDKFTSSTTTQVCEAAYLCSQGIKVQVLVSPSNFSTMKPLYQNLPGLPKRSPKPEVIPFLFSEKQLNVANMKTLMGLDNDDKNPPLYMAVVNKVIKQLALEAGTSSGIRFDLLKHRVDSEGLAPGQTSFLKMRYDLIEWFLREYAPQSITRLARKIDFDPQTLLIVDLSCPFITEADACSLFSIFLQVFLGQRVNHGLVVALDEAHKFMTETPAAKAFTEDLVQVIRQQRHLATRVVIATQEPTISPKLLDLCNVAIVHQFGSPDWFQTLKHHLAGLSRCRNDDSNRSTTAEGEEDVFKTIVRLKRGEALVFCPKAYLDVVVVEDDRVEYKPLQDGYVKVKIRPKVTADGGRSIVASDARP